MTEGIVIERKTHGEEPPPGVKGPGTADAPYDQGNAPETTTQPGSEPPNAQEGAGNATSPYDGGNAPEMTEKQNQAKTEAVEFSSTDNGTTDATKTTGKEVERVRSLDREVSPGTMPDGSHAQTSGDRGESYTPTTMSKLKNKFHIGGK